MIDSAYDAPQIKTHSRSLGHVPIIDPNPRSKTKKEELETEAKRRKAANYTLAEERRYHERSTVERINGRLKDEFGDQLTFWGASLDCQQTLPFGSSEEVAREVEQHVQVCKPGGGYVFAPVHNIQAGVPPENLLAMFDTALSVGSYD